LVTSKSKAGKMDNENDIIEKFLQYDSNKIEILLELIIQAQYCKMVTDINKVIHSLETNGDNSIRSIQMARKAVVSIYNAEMSYINIIWDNSKCWWDIEANTRFTDDFKLQFENCLKEKHLQTHNDWWRRIHILNFKEIIMAL
jgi:hypothetical protein